MYTRKLSEQEREVVNRDFWDSRLYEGSEQLRSGQKVVIRQWVPRSGDRIGQEYGAILTPTRKGTLVAKTVGSLTNKEITIPLLLTRDGILCSMAVPGIRQRHIGYILPGTFADGPITPQ